MTAALRALTIVVWSLAHACWVPAPVATLVDPGSDSAATAVQAQGSPAEIRRRHWLARRITSPPVALFPTVP